MIDELLFTTKAQKSKVKEYNDLIASNTKESKDKLYELFQMEKDDKLREVLKSEMTLDLYPKDLTLNEVKEIINFAKLRGKLNTWSEKNISKSDLPPLYIDNQALSDDELNFLFYRMGVNKYFEVELEAKFILNFIDKSSSSKFANYLLKNFLDTGAKADDKHHLLLGAMFGDDESLGLLKKIFNQLFEEKRMKMLQYVIDSLAYLNSIEALRYIDFLSKKYKTKQALFNKTIETLENYAKEQGLTIFELLDKLVPTFGFDELTLTMEISDNTYRVFIDNSFKLKYINEDNKISKTLPKGASLEQKEQMKKIQKEIKEANQNQATRLELYMNIQRRWSEDSWREFYLTNPLIFVYTSSILWGIYDTNNKLLELFYVPQDCEMLTIEDEDIELDSTNRIGIVHPLELTEEQILLWGEKFYELEVSQHFPQLKRDTYIMPSEIKNQTSITKYDGMKIKNKSPFIKKYLENSGWKKDVVDNGCIEFYKEYPEYNLCIDLGLYGVNVAYYDFDDDVVELENIEFYKLDTINSNGYYRRSMYDDVKKETLKNINDIVYSELILTLETIVRS